MASAHQIPQAEILPLIPALISLIMLSQNLSRNFTPHKGKLDIFRNCGEAVITVSVLCRWSALRALLP
jgi:hypothetical protein